MQSLEDDAASWCLLTGQPWTVWLELPRRIRNAFMRVVNARARR